MDTSQKTALTKQYERSRGRREEPPNASGCVNPSAKQALSTSGYTRFYPLQAAPVGRVEYARLPKAGAAYNN